MVDGVEFYVTECENAMPSETTPFAVPTERFRACTVLISFARSHTERSALWPLRHAFAFGHTSSAICDGAEWLQKLSGSLSKRLKTADHAMVTAMVYAGFGGDSNAETVQAAVDSLQQCFGASLAALLVVVETSLHQLSRVTGVSGFVVGANGTDAETARLSFSLPGNLVGPETKRHPPIFSGAGVRHCRFAHGAGRGAVAAGWDGHLVLASAADAQAMQCVAHVVAVPLFDGPWVPGQLRRFCQAVLEQAVELATKIYFAADGAIALGMFPSQIGMVPVMCASPSTILHGYRALKKIASQAVPDSNSGRPGGIVVFASNEGHVASHRLVG